MRTKTLHKIHERKREREAKEKEDGETYKYALSGLYSVIFPLKLERRDQISPAWKTHMT